MTSRSILALAALLASVSLPYAAANDWVQFRGPGGAGAADMALPDSWSDVENVIWKTPLEGRGASTPVIVGGKVFLTSGVGGANDLTRHVLCLDAATGAMLWDVAVESDLPEVESVREDHGYTSATPVASDSHLFVFFGKSGVFCFGHDGEQLWNTTVGTALNRWGSAASLTLHDDLVLVNACVESEALVALEQATGKERWRAEGLKESWHAPVLAEVDGKAQIIMAQAQYVRAFDADDGREVWNCKSGIAWYVCPQPIVKDGIAYVIGGRSGIGGLAVRLGGGTGDVTSTHRLWNLGQGTNVPSPLIEGDHLYFAHEGKGEAYCVNLESGEFVYQETLSPNPGQIYASPVLAGDRIVYLGRGGRAVIVEADPKFQIVGDATLENGRGVFNASPAIAGGRLFIRSDKFLYCIGKD